MKIFSEAAVIPQRKSEPSCRRIEMKNSKKNRFLKVVLTAICCLAAAFLIWLYVSLSADSTIAAALDAVTL